MLSTSQWLPGGGGRVITLVAFVMKPLSWCGQGMYGDVEVWCHVLGSW